MKKEQNHQRKKKYCEFSLKKLMELYYILYTIFDFGAHLFKLYYKLHFMETVRNSE